MAVIIFQDFYKIKNNWLEYLAVAGNKKSYIISLIYLAVVLIILPNFLQYIEQRPGVQFNDPVLELFNPIDFSWLTFILIYASLLIAILNLSDKPALLRTAILSYSVTVTFRIAAMYLLPLEPPSQMIPLNDPFVQLFGSGEILTKDLFFSGHTSTLFILFLTAENKALKKVLLGSTIIVAVLVILQHVHYGIDVFAAPVFAYTAYRIGKVI